MSPTSTYSHPWPSRLPTKIMLLTLTCITCPDYSNTLLKYCKIIIILLFYVHCYIKCPFLGLGAYFGQFSSNGISFHHELMVAMGLEF